MALLTTIVSFILIFTGVILAHELGHFFAAKLAGVKVLEFGIGYPPRMFGYKRGETIYSINWMPFGGFTKMLGEEDPSNPGSLASKSCAKRVLVLSGGAIVNALLPFMLFTTSLLLPHDNYYYPMTIETVAPNSPAELAGLAPGDTILSINGNAINNYGDLRRHIMLNLGKNASITVRTAEGSLETKITKPRWKPPQGQGEMGIQLKEIDEDSIVITRGSESFFKSLFLGAKGTVEVVLLYKNTLLQMAIGAGDMNSFVGPVGIAQITGEVAQSGIASLFQFAGILSLSLAVMNLLPLPALDGGRLVFVIIEWIRKKRISPQKEGRVHFIGFVMLILLMIVLTFQDISRIISG